MHSRPLVSTFVRRVPVGTRHVGIAATKSKPRNWSLDPDVGLSDVPPQKLVAGQRQNTRLPFEGNKRHTAATGARDDAYKAAIRRKRNQDSSSCEGQSLQLSPSLFQEKPRSLTNSFDAAPLNKWSLSSSKSAPEDKNTRPYSSEDLLEDLAVPQGTYDGNCELPSSDNAPFEGRDRRKRTNRPQFKERGSLLKSTSINDSPLQKYDEVDTQPVRPTHRIKKKNRLAKGSQRVDVYIPTTVTVGNLARLLAVKLDQLQNQMRRSGMGDAASHDYVLTSDYAALLAEEFGRNPVVSDEAAFDIHPLPAHPSHSSLPPRPPVVAIMGHVDHGKTTLLDTLRSTSVAKAEAGGITQHIGAFSIPAQGNGGTEASCITFLDTPGHAAFSAMRARGARITDIIVLVVAADDGIKPQTREVINLVKKEDGKVGVVVAVNKVDKPGIDIDSVQRALLSEGLQLELFGGDIPCVAVSGLTGQGLPELIETISAMAEMQDIRAERDGPAHGYVIESKVQKGLGPAATVLVLRGCLKIGCHIISGVSHAKVRLMKDAAGSAVKVAYPGMAVTVSGWKTLPSAGNEVLEGAEAEVKKAMTNRERKAQLDALISGVDAINESRRQNRDKRVIENAGEPMKEEQDGPKELRLIVKADVSGSVEAVVGAIQGIGNNEAMAKVVFSGVGDISEADVMMAKAVGGTIVGFSVDGPRSVQTLAARSGVPIWTSDVIYRLMDNVRQQVVDLLPVSIETAVTGEATVLQLFEIQVKAKETKKVAGCRVINGIVDKAQFARVIRDGSVVHEGKLETMRQLKRDVTEVRKGSECGLSFYDYQELRQGDLIQIFKRIEIPGIL